MADATSLIDRSYSRYSMNLSEFEFIFKYAIIIYCFIFFLMGYALHKETLKRKSMTKRELFFEYDKTRGLNNNIEIVRMMELLEYYCIDINELKRTYINDVLYLIITDRNIISDLTLDEEGIVLTKDINDYTVGELKQIIVKTEKYLTYESELNNKFSRSVLLSKHLNDKTTERFYSSINDDEVMHLDKSKLLFRDRYPTSVFDS
jgi:hypothetical protein